MSPDTSGDFFFSFYKTDEYSVQQKPWAEGIYTRGKQRPPVLACRLTAITGVPP